MKARPRSVERKVAEHLTAFFIPQGYSEVERIPVLGRTGPDVSINEFGLVVDVKSRLEVPKCYMTPAIHGDLYCSHLDGINFDVPASSARSVLVERWFDHMHEWTLAKYKTGITALVLHRPGMPIGKSILVIKDLKEFEKRWKQQ